MNMETRLNLAAWLEQYFDGYMIRRDPVLSDLQQFGITYDPVNKVLADNKHFVDVLVLSPAEAQKEVEARGLEGVIVGDHACVSGMELAESLAQLVDKNNKYLPSYKKHHRQTRWWAAVQTIKGELNEPAEPDMHTKQNNLEQ